MWLFFLDVFENDDLAQQKKNSFSYGCSVEKKFWKVIIKQIADSNIEIRKKV